MSEKSGLPPGPLEETVVTPTTLKVAGQVLISGANARTVLFISTMCATKQLAHSHGNWRRNM